MSDGTVLEERAQAALAWTRMGHTRVRANGEARPLFIEFAGTPKSGKSSTIESVRHFFHRMGFNVFAPSEGASRRSPKHLKDNLTAFNAWNACYAVSQVLESTYSSDRHDIAILDRGLFDAVMWFDLLSQNGSVTQEAGRTVQEFLLLPEWRDSIDVVVLMQADPRDCMQRENQNKLVRKTGRAMNPEFLSELNAVYEEVADRHSTTFNNFLRIDTSDAAGTRVADAARTVVDFTLGVIEAEME